MPRNALHSACRWCEKHGRTSCCCAKCAPRVACPWCGESPEAVAAERSDVFKRLAAYALRSFDRAYCDRVRIAELRESRERVA